MQSLKVVNMLIKIYGLYEPHTCKIRYIGRTRSSLIKRFREHISKSKRNYSNSHKENWIRNLLKNGIRPGIKLLKVVNCTWEESHIIEKAIIQKHLIKHKLVNGDDRGPGKLGKNIDKEVNIIRINKIKEHFNKEENKNNFYNEIYCYNSLGIYLKTYKSLKFVAEELNVKNCTISNHMKRLSNKSINNLYFRYFKTDSIKISNKYNSLYISLKVINIETNKEYIFKTIKEFAEYFKLKHWDLHQYRKGISTTRVLEVQSKYKISPL